MYFLKSQIHNNFKLLLLILFLFLYNNDLFYSKVKNLAVEKIAHFLNFYTVYYIDTINNLV